MPESAKISPSQDNERYSSDGGIISVFKTIPLRQEDYPKVRLMSNSEFLNELIIDKRLYEDLRGFFTKVCELTDRLKQYSDYREANKIRVRERIEEDKVWYLVHPEEQGVKRSHRGTPIREDPMPRINELKSEGKDLWSIHQREFDARLNAFNDAPLSWNWEVALEAVWIHAFISLMRDIRNFTGTSELFHCLMKKKSIWKVFAEVKYGTILTNYRDYLFEEQGLIIDIFFQVPRVSYQMFDFRYVEALQAISVRYYPHFWIRVPEEQLKTDLRAILGSMVIKSVYQELWVNSFHYECMAFEQAYSTLVDTHLNSFRLANLPTPSYGVTPPSNIILIDSGVEHESLLFGKVMVVFLREFSSVLYRWNCMTIRAYLERGTIHSGEFPVVRYSDGFLDWLDSFLLLKKEAKVREQFEEMLLGDTLKVLNLSAVHYLMKPANLNQTRRKFTEKCVEKNREHLTNPSIPIISIGIDETIKDAIELGHCSHHNRQ